MTKVLAFLCLLSLVACSSPQKITTKPLNEPLNAITAAINGAMSMGIQSLSENHRTAFSRPFLVKQSDEAMKKGFRERGRAKVTILGDERPYTLEVEVVIERGKVIKGQTDANYTFERYDKRLANRLLKDIFNGLHQALRERNVIDDFQPF